MQMCVSVRCNSVYCYLLQSYLWVRGSFKASPIENNLNIVKDVSAIMRFWSKQMTKI